MLDLEGDMTLDERSRTAFVTGLRSVWARDVYQALVESVPDSTGLASVAEATEAMRKSPVYPWFSHLERQQQKMMWRVMGDVVLDRRSRLVPNDAGPDRQLDLADDLSLPDWYTDVDIHIQPGSFWLSDLSAHIYELGARVVMLRDNDGYKFHRLFAETAFPEVTACERVVDVGCGFGKSTRVLSARFPGAEVIGIDLSAPNLRLAHSQSRAAGQAIAWRQAASYDTGLEDNSVDVFTGTMVLHEMPLDRIEATLVEAARVTRPGGAIRFLEFWPTGDVLRDATIYEHAERNNEPYFRDLFAVDAGEIFAANGVPGARWVPFDEQEYGLSPEGRAERSEWAFPWAVLQADVPV